MKKWTLPSAVAIAIRASEMPLPSLVFQDVIAVSHLDLEAEVDGPQSSCPSSSLSPSPTAASSSPGSGHWLRGGIHGCKEEDDDEDEEAAAALVKTRSMSNPDDEETGIADRAGVAYSSQL